MAWIWWAPLGAAMLHIFEEFVYPGGFPAWDRRYRPEISKSITPRLHFVVNALLLLLCLQVWELRSLDSTDARSVAAAAWVALAALLVSNAVFHVAGSIRTRSWSPGVVTGVVLYVPLGLVGLWWFLRSGRVTPFAALLAAAVGGSYHLWAKLIHRARAGRRTTR